MAHSLDAVVSQMHALGMPLIGPSELRLNTSGWVRYGPKKKGYYRIERRSSRAGREYYVGVFGFKYLGPYSIAYEGEELTADEIAALEQRRKIVQEREAKHRAQRIARASMTAHDIWRTASPSGSSPYLAKKHIPLLAGGGWIRFLHGDIVVPMVRYDLPEADRLKGVQLIRPDGTKLFTAGMAKAGCAAVIGMHQVRAPILICEGLATAASVWLSLARRLRVFVAFDAGNLLLAATIVRELHRDARLLICADDDFLTEGNPGRTKAALAARSIDRAGVVFPLFRHRGDQKLTDFNDLHCTEGLDEVALQIESALKWLPRI